MTKDQVLDDLKYARSIAEQGQFAPLLGGRIGLMWGCLLAPTLLIQGLILTGRLDVSQQYLGLLWMVFGIGGGIMTFILSRQIGGKPGAQSTGNQVEQAVWSGTTLMMFVFALAVTYSVLVLGKDYSLFDIIMAIAFGTQAVSYYVIAKVSGEKVLYVPMIIALALSAVVMIMVGNPNSYFIGAFGVVFTVIIPALTHLKNEPKNV